MRATTLLALMFLAACQRAPTPSPRPATAPAASTTSAAPAAPVATTPATSSPATSAASIDAYLIPGDFSRGTDRTMLEQRFGAANVRVGEVPGAEGETFRGIVLFPDDPARRAYLYFDDEQALRGLETLRVFDLPSRWHLDNGVRIGMPLAELVQLNGQPVEFTGFDWDYGGAISNWHGGRLQPAQDAPVARAIRLGHEDAGDDAYPMGDATFSSDDPRYPELGQIARVEEIGVSFPAGE